MGRKRKTTTEQKLDRGPSWETRAADDPVDQPDDWKEISSNIARQAFKKNTVNGVPVDQPPMLIRERQEYLIITVRADLMENQLNALARDGWNVKSIFDKTQESEKIANGDVKWHGAFRVCMERPLA